MELYSLGANFRKAMEHRCRICPPARRTRQVLALVVVYGTGRNQNHAAYGLLYLVASAIAVLRVQLRFVDCFNPYVAIGGGILPPRRTFYAVALKPLRIVTKAFVTFPESVSYTHLTLPTIYSV